jgi:UDP-glucuronate 4-epimerase
MDFVKILITGVAGFIGFHVAQKLIKDGNEVIGVDNLNNYYDINLKKSRLQVLLDLKLNFHNMDIKNSKLVLDIFKKHKPEYVINLAAQAGVRYSLTNPQPYIMDNVLGFLNILESCRSYPVNHIVYASSSSVYGFDNKSPFSENQITDTPINLYAVSKKSNELMAFSYSHLYNLKCTGLRFFTVYGPWGRPDMAYFKFVKNIINDVPIDVYGNGKVSRDFTFIDDIVEGVISALDLGEKMINNNIYEIFNLGNNKLVDVKSFIETIERILDKKAIKNYVEMQLGDMDKTLACIDKSKYVLNYSPKTNIEEGLKVFINWYKKFYY